MAPHVQMSCVPWTVHSHQVVVSSWSPKGLNQCAPSFSFIVVRDSKIWCWLRSHVPCCGDCWPLLDIYFHLQPSLFTETWDGERNPLRGSWEVYCSKEKLQENTLRFFRFLSCLRMNLTLRKVKRGGSLCLQWHTWAIKSNSNQLLDLPLFRTKNVFYV